MTALIWDLDGTLLDSYGVIVDSTLQALREAGITAPRQELHRRMIAGTVRGVLGEIGRERGLDGGALWRRVDELNQSGSGRIRLMDGAAEALRRLRELGIASFVYTHNSDTAKGILDRCGVLGYFTYILTSAAGLPRKPAPDGIEWIVNRFGLDKSRTFYVGDRPIDAACADSAGVGFIFFKPPESPAVPTGTEWATVSRLTQLPGLFEGPAGA